MRIAVPTEVTPGERRVAIVPDSVKRLLARKIEVSIEAGAGAGSFARDEEYAAAGATVEPSRQALLAAASAVVMVRAPTPAEVPSLKEGSVLVGLLSPRADLALVRALAARRITSIAVDLIPRVTAAQAMDALSSQATAGGYAAVLAAATALPRFFPMLMTAAGTIAPARVLVLGAGVAGLTAIGAARRLGAVVEAFDVRRAVKEQVESVGARFIEVPGEDAEAAGGYAGEVSAAYRERQSRAIAEHLARADVCITTALVPGRRAPVLVTAAMVQAMKPGSVIVDMAAEQRGNCELTEPGAVVVKHGVTIVGETNLPSRVSVHASQMYSRNMEKLLSHVTRDGAPAIDLDDEIMRGAVVTRGGEVVHPEIARLLS
jgi:NAD(P) transhydrogenase subunit alpha